MSSQEEKGLRPATGAELESTRPAPPAGADTGRDVAMAVVGEERHTIDSAVAARARRKIDLFLIPAMTIGCMEPLSHSQP